MKKSLFAFGICGLILLGCTSSPYEPTPEVITQFKSCTSCHGAATHPEAPSLNGIQSWYAKTQLMNIKQGIRSAPEGKSICTDLPEMDDLKELSRYIGTLEAEPQPITLTADPQNGATLHAMCQGCHGEDAKGSKFLKSPQLADLQDQYMLNQLRHFKNGTRGQHAKDSEGKKMVAIVQAMTDQDLQDVTHYIVETFGEKSN